MNGDFLTGARTFRHRDADAGLKALGEIAVQLQESASVRFQQLADGAVNREVIQPFIAEVILVDTADGRFQARFEDRLAETGAKRFGRIIEIALNKIPTHCDELNEQRTLDFSELIRIIALAIRFGNRPGDSLAHRLCFRRVKNCFSAASRAG